MMVTDDGKCHEGGETSKVRWAVAEEGMCRQCGWEGISEELSLEQT